MKDLNTYITEKLKIRKSKQYTFDFRRQYPVSHQALIELIDKLYGSDTIHISKSKTSIFYSEVTCDSEDVVIKILVLIYLIWNPMFNNYPSSKETEEFDSNYLEYYIEDKSIRDFADEHMNEIESMVEELGDTFKEIYDDVRKKQ